jgi:hypothetical protein
MAVGKSATEVADLSGSWISIPILLAEVPHPMDLTECLCPSWWLIAHPPVGRRAMPQAPFAGVFTLPQGIAITLTEKKRYRFFCSTKQTRTLRNVFPRGCDPFRVGHPLPAALRWRTNGEFFKGPLLNMEQLEAVRRGGSSGRAPFWKTSVPE